MTEVDTFGHVDGVPGRDHQRFGVPAVAGLPHHLVALAELLAAAAAAVAPTAAHDVVDGDSAADPRLVDPFPHGGDDAGDLVAQREWKVDGGETVPVVDVGVADAGGNHVDDHLAGTGLRR